MSESLRRTHRQVPCAGDRSVVKPRLLADRIFDLDLCLIHTGFGVGAAGRPHDSLNASERSRTSRDVRDSRVAKLPRTGAVGKDSPAGKKLVAIFEDIHIVRGGGAIVVDVIGNATRPCFLHLCSVDDGGAGRKGAINFKGSHLMTSNVADVEKLLLCVFGIFSTYLVGNRLCLLGERIAGWYGNCETQQGHSRQNDRGTPVHDYLLVWTQSDGFLQDLGTSQHVNRAAITPA